MAPIVAHPFAQHTHRDAHADRHAPCCRIPHRCQLSAQRARPRPPGFPNNMRRASVTSNRHDRTRMGSNFSLCGAVPP